MRAERGAGPLVRGRGGARWPCSSRRAAWARSLAGGARARSAGGLRRARRGAVALLARARRPRAPRRRTLLAAPFPARWRAFLERALRPLPAPARRTCAAASRTTCASSWPRSASRASRWRSTDELRLLVAASAVTLSRGLAGLRVGPARARCCSTRRTSTATTRFERRRAVRPGASPGARSSSPCPRCARASTTPTTATTSASTSSPTCSTSTRRTSTASRAGLRRPRAPASGWTLVEQEMDRLRRGKSVHRPLRRRGARPSSWPWRWRRSSRCRWRCAQRHREVYAILRDYFGQDPAAWDDARGLVL